VISDFSIAYHADKAYIGGKFVPAGTLACSALNLPKETISYLESLYRRQRKGADSRELRDALYSLDCVSAVTDLLPDNCLEVLDQLICFRAYIKHFLQRYDVSANSGEAWEAFLDKLDDLVAQARNMDNYSRTVLQPNLCEATIVYNIHAGKLCEEIGISYGDILLFDLLRSMEHGHPPRLCPCCGNWFIPSRGDEVYCSSPAPDADGRTCREVGAARAFAKRADSSEPLGLCRAACSRIYTRKNRGQVTAEQAAELTAECRRLRDLALAEEITIEELRQQLDLLSCLKKSKKAE